MTDRNVASALTGLASLVAVTTLQFSHADNAEPHDRGLRWMPQNGEELRFDVLRDGNEFGEHIVRFETTPNGVQVQSSVDLEVKFGPIRVFHYAHESEELWEDGRLVSLEGNTRKDGDDFVVQALQSGNELSVEGTLFSGSADPTIVPSSHWNIEEVFSDVILSTESGELLSVDVTALGTEIISAGNATITADRYRLVSDLVVDLWYDQSGRWVKCQFEARGQTIEYILR